MAEINRPYDLKDHYYMYDIGWLIDKIQAVSDELGQAIDLRTIHYADPINWDITTQYQANTVVVDNKTGVAYISSQNVPAGVLLTNTTYWNPIYNYNDAINKLMSTIAYNEQDSPTATAAHVKDSFIYSNATLYQAIKDIADGDALKVGANIRLVTLSDSIIALISSALTDALDAISAEATTRAGADAALSKRIDAEATARADADTALSKRIDAEAAARVDADANYTGTNRVSTVTGDDTRTAGDITDTADNVVIHGKKSILMDSDGTYTEDIAGAKNTNAASITETVSGNRELGINSDDSVHIDGASTLNVGGLRTEVYAADKSDSVKGSHTINRNNITATITDKTNITAKDVTVSADKISINSTVKSLPLVFPDKTVNLYNVDNIGGGGEKKVIIALGDSLGSGISPTLAQPSEYGWLKQLEKYSEKHKNVTVYTNDKQVIAGNSGFASSAPYLTQLKLIVSDNKINMADVTDIVIFGGTNDCAFVKTTLPAALDEFFTYVKNNFPNAACLIGTLIAYYRDSGALMRTFRNYTEKYGYKYTPDIYNLCLRASYVSSDNVHLTAEGYKAIYPYLVECALKGYTHYYFSGTNLYANAIAIAYLISESSINMIFGTTAGTAIYLENVNIAQRDTQILDAPTTLEILCNMPYTRFCSVLVRIGDTMQIGDFFLDYDGAIYVGLPQNNPAHSGAAILSSGSTQHFISALELQH